ncbi:MAG: NAD(P)H-hydrate epimerase, partial [Pseudomonas sp.]
MPVTHHQLPLPLYRAAQVRELDTRLIAAGTPAFELMQRAAHGAWRALRQRWPQAGGVTVLAGSGNNAGDGYLVAALAQRAGWQVQVLAVVAPSALRETAAEAYAEALAAGVAVQPWRVDIPLHGVVVDALLGTGLAGAVREPFAAAIGQINASNLPVLALDLPSGLCADTGAELGVAVQAELTVTFIALKLGLLTGAGPDRVGVLQLDDLHADAQVLTAVAPAAQRLAPANL